MKKTFFFVSSNRFIFKFSFWNRKCKQFDFSSGGVSICGIFNPELDYILPGFNFEYDDSDKVQYKYESCIN